MHEEQILKELEELKKRLERTEAINEIQRLMGTYYCMHLVNPDPKFAGKTMWDSWKLWANRPDSSVEISTNGLYLGIDNVRAFYERGRPGPDGKLDPAVGYTEREMKRFGAPGQMFVHTLATPMIVVAEDGQTARGLWDSPGHETYNAENGLGDWVWGRTAADFIKEDGVWKIWHYHWYRTFRSPYDTCWTKVDQRGSSVAPQKSSMDLVRNLGGDPDRILPTTWWHTYSPNDFVEPIPFTPQPYETWTEDRFPI